MTRDRASRVEMLGLLAGLVVLWEAVVRALNVPHYLVPPPSDVARALFAGLAASPTARDAYYIHAVVTLLEALAGFALGSALGFVLATLLSQSRTVEDLLLPYIVAFQSLPKIAFAPLMMV